MALNPLIITAWNYNLVVPYIDGNSSPQEPEFSIPDIQNWAAQLYRMTIKTRMNLLQTENIPERFSGSFP
jgi:hypothetical protein